MLCQPLCRAGADPSIIFGSSVPSYSALWRSGWRLPTSSESQHARRPDLVVAPFETDADLRRAAFTNRGLAFAWWRSDQLPNNGPRAV